MRCTMGHPSKLVLLTPTLGFEEAVTMPVTITIFVTRSACGLVTGKIGGETQIRQQSSAWVHYLNHRFQTPGGASQNSASSWVSDKS